MNYYCNSIQIVEQNSSHKTWLLKRGFVAILVAVGLLAGGKTWAQITGVNWELSADGTSLTLSASTAGHPLTAQNIADVYTAISTAKPTTIVFTSYPTPTEPTELNFASIATEAFKGKTDIQTVTWPANVTTIPASVFEGCTALATITGIEDVTTIGASAFKGAAFIDFELPAGIAAIADNTFEGCASLTKLTIKHGATVVTLGTGALKDCDNLASIVVPAAQLAAYKAAWTSYQDKISTEDIYTVSFANPADGGIITGTYGGNDGTENILVSGSEVPFGSKIVLTLELPACYDLAATPNTGWTKKTGTETNYTAITTGGEFTPDNTTDARKPTLTFTLSEIGDATFSATLTASATTYTVTEKVVAIWKGAEDRTDLSTTTPAETPTCGEKVELDAADYSMPAACYTFKGWEMSDETKEKYEISDADLLASGLTIASIESDIEVTAVFEFASTAAFSVSPEGIADAPALVITFANPAAIPANCDYEITATPATANNDCYEFGGFFNAKGEEILGASADDPYEFDFEGDTALTVLYKPKQFAAGRTITGSGKLNLVKVNGQNPTAEQLAAWGSTLTVDCGTKLVVQPIAAEGNNLTSLKIGNDNVPLMPNETDKYEIVIGADNTTIVATFTASTSSRVVWRANNSDGNIAVTGVASGNTVKNGTKLTFTATPVAEGAEFVEWQINTQTSTIVLATNPLELVVARDVAITAVFKSAITTGESSLAELGAPAKIESDGTPIYDKIIQKPAVAVDASKLVAGGNPGTVEVVIYEWDDAKDPVNHRGTIVYSETIQLTSEAAWQGNLKVAIYGSGRGIMVITAKDGAGAIRTTETTVFKMDNVRRPFIKRRRNG